MILTVGGLATALLPALVVADTLAAAAGFAFLMDAVTALLFVQFEIA